MMENKMPVIVRLFGLFFISYSLPLFFVMVPFKISALYLFMLFIICMSFMGGIGILFLKEWGRIIGLFSSVLAGISFMLYSTYSIYCFLSPSVSDQIKKCLWGGQLPILSLVMVVIFLFVLYGLTRPKVKEQFK